MFRSGGIKASLMVLVLLVSGTTIAFSASAAYGPKSDTWTVALYVGADNNLEVAWDQYTLPALLGIPASKRVNIVAMVDRMSTTDSMELLEFSGETCTVVTSYPEMNTGDGATFKFFLDEVAARYPAENMCVVPWNHGGSWFGFCSDETSGNDIIRMNEFSAAVTGAAMEIDILAFDACIMSAAEVAYEAYATDLVTYVVASEMYVPFDGFPYDLMFAPLAEDPTATPEELCDLMLVGWEAYYHYGRAVNLVVTDVAAFGAGLPAFQAWSEALIAGLDTYGAEYAAAAEAAVGCDYAGPMPDVYDLCEQLIATVDDGDIQDACADVMAVIDAAVVGLHSSRKTADMHGISIWWATTENDYYSRFIGRYMDTVQFATDSGWGAFQTALFT